MTYEYLLCSTCYKQATQACPKQDARYENAEKVFFLLNDEKVFFVK